jgi:hypothetical protein
MYFLARFFILLSICAQISWLHQRTRMPGYSHFQAREVHHAALVMHFHEKHVAHTPKCSAVKAACHRQKTALHGGGNYIAVERFAKGKLVGAVEGGHA